MSKIYQNILIVAGIILSLFLAWYFRNIVAYLLISAILSLVGKPIVGVLGKIRIKEKKLPRWLCVSVALGTIMFIFYLFLSFFIPLITSHAQALANVNINDIVTLLTDPFVRLEEFINTAFPGSDFSFNTLLFGEIKSIFNSDEIVKYFGSIAGLIVSMAVAVFSISFITFFFMKEENLFIDGVVILFPAQYESGIRHAWNNSTKLLMRYFIGVFLDMICVMTILTIGLKFVVGLNFSTAILLGFIAGILNVIPYVGPLIAAVVSIVVTMANLNTGIIPADTGYSEILLKVLGVFITMKILDDTVFQPYIFANSIKAHPLEIFLLILIAGSFAGVGGMLIAIPTYTILRVFAKEFLNRFRFVQKLTERT
ncbi:MAG: AI-2E family transporter [Prevotellaceae bacterium]|jgi:predicted PurR-regulated permease PerM|nr:AI-2E family transporter [Prevotellaceae bacterium]